MSEIISLSLEQLATKIKDAQLSSVDVCKAFIERIEKYEKDIKAWAHFDKKVLLEKAEEADEHRRSGKPLGYLHGVPVAVKDIIGTIDMPTECGTVIRKGKSYSQNAEIIDMLHSAGALVMGKTATSELAFLGPSDTTNPHDNSRTPGGSSSGSAAAVASFMAPVSIGSQTGGSIIRPASYCGVVGYKPTYGDFDKSGILPNSPSNDTLGLMARSIDDIALMRSILIEEKVHLDNKINLKNKNTIFIKDKNTAEIWNLILDRLKERYSSTNLQVEFNNSSIILSGIKKEFISRLICKMLDELDNLVKNIKENYKEKDFKDDLNSLIKELKVNTISNITDSYFRLKKGGESISINDFMYSEVSCEEIDRESHESIMFIEPIIKNEALDYDGKLLPLYETESFLILENIISNWTIRNCNLLASEIFNICSSWPELRTVLINPELQSTRNFERFRNNINNYNRWHDYIYMPIYLYESKREYIDIIDKKFTRYFKNENREKELENLEWLQKQVTLLVEIRDAVAPQLEVAVKYIGNLFVTFLTKVVGKAIGLVGKGILQGLGRSSSK